MTSPGIDLSALSPAAIVPVLIVVVGSFAALLGGVFSRRRSVDVAIGISVGALALSGLSIMALHPLRDPGPVTAFSRALVVDGLALVLSALFIVAAFVSLLLAVEYLRLRPRLAGEFCALILMATSGMMIMAMAQDLIVAFIALEVLSIALYVLAGFSTEDHRSNEAALKYLLLGAFASGFFLFGIGLLYGALGTTVVAGVGDQVVRPGFETLVPLGVGLLLIGLGFKAGFAPFHLWVPDVYQGSPTPVSAFMAAGPKAAAFALLFRIVDQTFVQSPELWQGALWGLAVATMTLANLAALRQTEAKRLLAYSSIAHAGYLLLGVLAGAFDRAGAVTALVFYLIIYALMKLGAFAVVELLQERHEGDLDLSAFRGLSRRHPGLAVAMGLLMFSLAGIPPLAGFWAKMLLFSTAIRAGLIGLVVIAVLNSVVAAYYYLRVVVIMYMEPGEEPTATQKRPGALFATWATSLASVVLGILPTALVELSRRVAGGLL